MGNSKNIRSKEQINNNKLKNSVKQTKKKAEKILTRLNRIIW